MSSKSKSRSEGRLLCFGSVSKQGPQTAWRADRTLLTTGPLTMHAPDLPRLHNLNQIRIDNAAKTAAIVREARPHGEREKLCWWVKRYEPSSPLFGQCSQKNRSLKNPLPGTCYWQNARHCLNELTGDAKDFFSVPPGVYFLRQCSGFVRLVFPVVPFLFRGKKRLSLKKRKSFCFFS